MKPSPTYPAPCLRYRVSPLRDESGNVSPHFLTDEFQQVGITWEQAMSDPIFAQIIEKEVAAEKVAHAPLEHLAALAPSDRVRTRFVAWMRFIDENLEPWTTGGAIHFRPHWARVLMIALFLGDGLGLSDADLDALAMAAVFHDSRRRNPYLDTGHGMRASVYYEEAVAHQEQLTAETDNPKSAHSPDESDATNTESAPVAHPTLVYDPRTLLSIRWHDRDDNDGLAALSHAQGLLEHAPEGAQADASSLYLLFKDADGLDRVRLGENQLDTRFLRTQVARDSVDYARELLNASFQGAYTDM